MPSERLIERALALLVQSEVAPDEAAQQAHATLSQWRRKSAQHDAAVREAHRRWSALSSLAPNLRDHFDPSAPAAVGAAHEGLARQRRKLLLSVAGAVGASAVLGRSAWWYWQQPVLTASYTTPAAQTLMVRLADRGEDGDQSRLDLAPQTAVRFTLYRQRRSVALAHGEVRFDVATDARRPFEVLTREARIEVIGTVFTVRDRGGPITVGVESGRVRVQVLAKQEQPSPDQPGTAVELLPGEALDIGDGEVHAVRQINAGALSAWRDGWLVFDNALLSEALKTINAYRLSPIKAVDQRVGDLRLTGRFRANDSAGLVAALPTILPINIRALPDGAVELSMR